jgi:hypothetical protein
VTVSGGSGTYMTIYAPRTSLTVSGGGPFFGAPVCKTLKVSGNSSLHYDVALPDVWSVFWAVAGFRANANSMKIGPAQAGPFFHINVLRKEASKTRSV